MKKIKLLLVTLAVGAMFVGCASTSASKTATEEKALVAQSVEEEENIDPEFYEKLTAKGIKETESYGKKKYFYGEETPEKGKSYMCLDRYKKTNLVKEGLYSSVLLYEVVDKDEEHSIEVNNRHIKKYPSAGYLVNDTSSIKLGEVIVFDSVETLFGKEWITTKKIIESGWEETEPSLNDILVSHNVQITTLITIDEKLGLEVRTADDGSKFAVYCEPKPEKGKSYMCLNYDRKMEPYGIKGGIYNVMLFEVVDKNAENSIMVNNQYIRKYPSAIYWFYDGTIKVGDVFGKVIVFDSDETLFGKSWGTMKTSFSARGYKENIAALPNISVYHEYQSLVLVEKAKLGIFAKKGLEFSSGREGVYTVYSEINDFEKDKTYMCLDGTGKYGRNFSKEQNHVQVLFYEVVDENAPNSVKVGSKYIESYPTVNIWMADIPGLEIPEEIVFDDVKTLFGKSWEFENEPRDGWGWRTKDPDLNIEIDHKFKRYDLKAAQ